MLYLDTSALLKLHIRESGSVEVQQWVTAQDDPLPVWEIQEMELTNALRLKVFWGELTEAEAEAQIVHVRDRKRRGLYFHPEIHRSDLMDTFRRLSTATMRLGCRTIDVLHVACALQLAPAAFVSFDTRRCTLAREAGLSVLGAPPPVAPDSAG